MKDQFVFTDEEGMHAWTEIYEEWVREPERENKEEKYRDIYLIKITDGARIQEHYARQIDAFCAAWIIWRQEHPDPGFKERAAKPDDLTEFLEQGE